MTSADKFNKARSEMCSEGRAFARGKSLNQAWRTCQHGGWMAWWLHERCRIELEELRTLARANNVGDRWSVLSCRPWSEQDILNWSRVLRQHYHASGRRRVVRSR